MLQAQRQNRACLDYIDRFNTVAVEHMRLYRIPASITLSQGILESGAGKSDLATRANNHFGIKCGSDWSGPYVLKTDDAPNERFRSYKNVIESYIDHSKFLAERSRYSSLFTLEITDYKGWAHGLKKAGYATDPSYANRLITIIETYELYRFDTEGKKSKTTVTPRNTHTVRATPSNAIHEVYLSNDLAYIRARRGDTFDKLAKEFNISASKLRKYNDLHKGYTLADGDIVYLHSKRTKSKRYATYVVRDGDSMHTISQLYGIKLKSLYKLNKLDPEEYVPQIGAVLRLR